MFTPKPDWLKVKLPLGRKFIEIKGLVKHLKLATVCEEANCPNMGECWAGGTATFMLLGKVCTRGCRFCNVESGKPQPPDPAEPLNILKAVSSMRLSYVVLTMVTRDDLPDGGAQHIYNTVKTLKDNIKNLAVETLVSDLAGNEQSIKKVLDAEPDVFAHNVETVPSLQKMVRDARCNFEKSVFVLEFAKKLKPFIYTKSSLMLGCGEQESEVIDTMKKLQDAGVDILTIGQYLQPTKKHLQVKEYIHPSKFEYFKKIGEELGFKVVASGPLVRSSYKAVEQFVIAKNKN